MIYTTSYMQKARNPYHFLNTYCLRTPIFSLNFYKNIINKDGIEEIWKSNTIKEAVFLASPELYEQLYRHLELEIDKSVKFERLKQTFLKYSIRASTRCTPFGLFAGVATGSFDKSTAIKLKPLHQYNRVTKFDTNYLSSLLKYISTIDTIKSQLQFYPNMTLYKVVDQYRYIEYLLDNTKRSYSIEAIEFTTYLEKVISASKMGSTLKELANELVDKDISLQEAKNFLEILIDNQILVSELELNVTGEDALVSTLRTLAKLNNTGVIVAKLKSLQDQLERLDKKIGNDTSQYLKIIEIIKKIEAPFNSKYLFQTDLFSQTKLNMLNLKHAFSIKKIIPFLNRLKPYRPNKNLEQFKKAFLERYESREVSLIQVLDIELGIGYIQNSNISDTTPFLQDITPKNKNIKVKKTRHWSEVDIIIYNKLLRLQENDNYILELTDKDFEHIESNWNYTPDTLSVFVEIVIINDEEQLIIHGLCPGAGNLLARFCHGDTTLLKHVKDITNIEQQMNPKKILAEIAHLPEARVGNILKRPHLREYEIPYLTKSNLSKSQQIEINDLMVSVKNDTIILTSKRLQKEVLPKLTNAHNYAPKALPVYHFLCDLQNQHMKSNLGFSWHPVTEDHDFLPRVIYKNTILSKARWLLSKDTIKLFILQYDDKQQLLRLIEKWRINFKIPRYVQLVESDNTLLIDLENCENIRLLLNTVKNKEKCILKEFLFTEDTVVKRGYERFTNECIITLYNKQKLKNSVS